MDTPTDISAISGKSYVFTAYAKPAGRDWLAIQLQSAFGGGYAYFDLSNGTIGTNTTLSESITSVGDGWYRISITVNAVSTGTGAASFVLAAGDNVPSYSGDGTSGVYIWAAQLEPSTTATNYVRTVDVVGKAYQWYEPTEGTVFVEHENAAVTQDIIKFHAGSLSNSFAAYSGSGTSPVFFMRTSGANQASIGVGSLSSPFSTSFAVKHNDTNIASNGIAGVPDTSTILPIVDTVDFGSSTVNVGSTSISKHIKRLTYWPVRQADSTLQVITQ
jgi:hypothetical protein